jgi:XRE family transcriptional regulator, master regulator for biofilm formation
MLGTRIKALRQKKRLTLSELAEKTEISKSYLSHIERNIQTNPSIEVIMKIALGLEVDIQTLIMPKETELISVGQSESDLMEWSSLLYNALKSGLIDDRVLKEILLFIQNGKFKS